MSPRWALLALLIAAPPAWAGVVTSVRAVPPAAASAALGAAAAPSPSLPDPGTTLSAFTLATHLMGPGRDALPALKAQTILDLGAGRDLALARHLVGVQGFDPAKVHAADPLASPERAAPLAPANVRRVKAEELPSDWAGKFDTVFSFFAFNPEIVGGDTPGMGDGIDVEGAAEGVHAVLKPGGRAVIVTGGANGLDAGAKAAFLRRLTLVRQLQDSLHVFQKRD